MKALFWRWAACRIASPCLAYSFGGKQHHSPPSTSKELVFSGDLGFDSLINHRVWTAGIKEKLHVSRPGAMLWSGDKIKASIYYQRVDCWLSISHSHFSSGSQDAFRAFLPPLTLIWVICTFSLNKVRGGWAHAASVESCLMLLSLVSLSDVTGTKASVSYSGGHSSADSFHKDIGSSPVGGASCFLLGVPWWVGPMWFRFRELWWRVKVSKPATTGQCNKGRKMLRSIGGSAGVAGDQRLGESVSESVQEGTGFSLRDRGKLFLLVFWKK